MRLFTTLLIAFSLGANAQTATDFNIDDVDGINRDLFTELDNGNVVVLKFFTDWCPICHNTAADVVSIYNTFQSNGDAVVFWALDRDPNETNADAIAYRNANSIPFPVIGEASAIAAQFNVQYQPEYRIIRPDRSYVSASNYTAMQNAVNEALASITTSITNAELDAQIVVADKTIFWNGEETQSSEVQVVDMSGRVVLQEKLKGKQKLELHLSAGVYVYRLETENGNIATGKIGLAD
jgi:peroxiredoxin